MKTKVNFSILLSIAILIVNISFAQTTKSRVTTKATSANASGNQSAGKTTSTLQNQSQNTRNSVRNSQQESTRSTNNLRNETRANSPSTRNRGRTPAMNTNTQADSSAAPAAQTTPETPPQVSVTPKPTLVLTQPQSDQDANKNRFSLFAFRKDLGQPDLEPSQSIYPDTSNESGVDLKPSYSMTLSHAKTLYRSGIDSFLHQDYAASARSFSKLTEIVPNSVYANFAYGLSLFLTDNYRQALELMTRSSELSIQKNILLPKLRQLKVNRRDFNYHFFKLSSYKQNFTGEPDYPILLNFLTRAGSNTPM